MRNYMPQGLEYNPEAIKKITELNKKIEKEATNEKPNNEKLMQMRMELICQGMKLNSGYYGNNYRAMYPY